MKTSIKNGYYTHAHIQTTRLGTTVVIIDNGSDGLRTYADVIEPLSFKEQAELVMSFIAPYKDLSIFVGGTGFGVGLLDELTQCLEAKENMDKVIESMKNLNVYQREEVIKSLGLTCEI